MSKQPPPHPDGNQETRVLAALSPGRIVPRQALIDALYPHTGATTLFSRNVLGAVVRRLRGRGYKINSVTGRGYQLVSTAPDAVPPGTASPHRRPAPSRRGLPPRQCLAPCRKMFTPAWETNYRCPSCHERAVKIGGEDAVYSLRVG